ncbi:hypothetical protein [Phytohabitans rumicis]|nr:hypothetical protein [Phytohabitans rumicis]
MDVRRHGIWLAGAVFALTMLQLAVATAVPDLPQFAGKGFAARLFAYPVMMLVVPGLWWLLAGRRGAGRVGERLRRAPWIAFAWIMLPFLVDVTGNTLDLYDSIGWWDDANHLVNWFFLSLGAGLLLRGGASGRPWELLVMIGGLGAVMAIGWEIGEYFAFIRGGTELDTAYQDTLGDLTLGTLGAVAAGAVVARGAVRRPRQAQ